MITNPAIWINEFLSEQDVNEATRKNYHNTLMAWVTWLTVNGISWGEVRKPHVIRYKNELYEKGRSPLYINTCLSIFRKFYRYLDDAGLYPDIASGVKGHKLYHGFRKRPLTPEQVDMLLSSIDTETKTGKREHLIIRMMVTSGLRSVEVSRLDIGDFTDGSIPGLRILGKGRKEKTFVRISRDVADELRGYIGRRMDKIFDPVFIVSEGQLRECRVTPKYIGIFIKARMKKAGLDDKLLSAHSLRHTTAVMMINQGASLYDVQSQLRHTDANMTRNYLRFIEEEKRHQLEWVDKLEMAIRKRGQIPIPFTPS